MGFVVHPLGGVDFSHKETVTIANVMVEHSADPSTIIVKYHCITVIVELAMVKKSHQANQLSSYLAFNMIFRYPGLPDVVVVSFKALVSLKLFPSKLSWCVNQVAIRRFEGTPLRAREMGHQSTLLR